MKKKKTKKTTKKKIRKNKINKYDEFIKELTEWKQEVDKVIGFGAVYEMPYLIEKLENCEIISNANSSEPLKQFYGFFDYCQGSLDTLKFTLEIIKELEEKENKN